ncbi:AraC family transcriptional regulator [Verrucomicrobium sp. BvORR106]|uniref:AraC family transcriptional regulator n=1 Tax=Verrucomicrobium sp. BvORR106 TaxID=1403819 RepID=UPI00068F5BFE|nr:AraC family transcriptional regulator [Verrucomicrobium sp. BvORR106]
MKSLDSLLSTLRLRSALQNRVVLGEPWGVRFPVRPQSGKFHFMEQGSGQLCVPECPPTIMRQGDFAIVMTDREHTVQDLTGSRPTPLPELLSKSDTLCASGITLRFGGAGAETSVISGDFDFAESAHHPLLRLLPPCLILRGNGEIGAPGLDAVLKVLTTESMAAQPGATALLDRLCDVLFIQAIRGWLHTGDSGTGLPAAVQNAAIDGALHLIQSEPANSWTVEYLAREVALSRSVFAERFRRLTGDTPMGYLARWRAHCATRLLQDEQLGMMEVASRVGYESEFAFAKAFKRITGIAPGAYRRSKSGVRVA